MARALNGLAALMEGFNAGYQTTGRVLRDIDIAKIAAANPEAVAAAPNLTGDPTDITTPVAKTQFLGQTYDKPLDDAGITRARQLAMAGVMEKYGDVEGGQGLRERIANADLAQERAARERELYPLQLQQAKLGVSTAERADRTGARAEKKAVDIDALNADVGKWMESRLVNPDGTKRAPTSDDYLASAQYRAGKLFESGAAEEANQAMQQYHAAASAKIALDTQQRNEAIGRTVASLASGDLTSLQDFYNRYVPDGAKVTSVARGKDGSITVQREAIDGTKLPPTTLKDVNQAAAVLRSFSDPKALYEWSQGEFHNLMQQRQLAVSQGNLGLAQAANARAQADFEAMSPERQARGEAGKLRIELANLDTTTPEGKKRELQITEKLSALATGTRGAGAMGGHDPAAVKSAQALVAAGQYPDMGTALEGVINKPDQTHKAFVEIGLKNMMKPAEAAKAADEAMFAMGWQRNGTRWSKATGAQAPAAAMPKAQADAHTQAKAAIAQGAPREAVNQRLKQAGFDPLP